MSHTIFVCLCVFRGKGLWVGFGMRWFRCSIPPHGTVIVACVYVCQRECAGDSRLSVLADAHHMELFAPSTLRPAGHAHTRFSLCLSHFVCSHVLLLFTHDHFLFSVSLHVAPHLFSLPLSLCVCVFLCAFSLLCLFPVVHCFQKVKLCLTENRWQAGL